MNKSIKSNYFSFKNMLLFLCFVCLVSAVNATIYYVEEGESIQTAMNSSYSGDTIVVAPGNYTENINFANKNIVVTSSNPFDVAIVESTIIRGNTEGTGYAVVRFSGSETSACKLTGFTLIQPRTGYNVIASAGSYSNSSGTKATIENNIISDNAFGTNTVYTAGISNCDGLIQNNIIKDNTANTDIGIFLCDGTIIKNRFLNNTINGSSSSLLGISWINYSNSTTAYVYNNIFAHNAGAGKIEIARYSYNNSNPVNVANNTISENYNTPSVRIYCGRRYYEDYQMNNIICNTTHYSNDTYNDILYSCIHAATPYSSIFGYTSGTNIFLDYPTETPEFKDVENYDFRLAEGSPCIDTGTTDTNYNDNILWGDGNTSRNDIGAYGGPNNEWPIAINTNVYDFDSDADGWTTQGLPGVYEVPAFSSANGELSIISATNDPTPSYGCWESPRDEIAYAENTIYKVTLLIEGTVEQEESPLLRLSVHAESETNAVIMEVPSISEEAPGDDEARLYTLFIDPMDQTFYQVGEENGGENADDLYATAELINCPGPDDPDGGFKILAVTIDRIDKDLIEATNVATFDSTADFDDWVNMPAATPFIDPEYTAPRPNGGIEYIATTNTNTAGGWRMDYDHAVEIEADMLYRAKFTISSTTDQDDVPQVRLMVFTESAKMTLMHLVTSNITGVNSPTSPAKVYELYFYPPQSDVGTYDGLLFGVEMTCAGLGDAADGDFTLEKVEIEKIDMTKLNNF